MTIRFEARGTKLVVRWTTPELAATQATGCGDHNILNHCRDGGVPVQGCWAIDGLLGKETAHVSAHDAFARVQWAAEGDEETTPARATIYLGGGTDFYPHRVAGEAAAAFGVKARERDYKRRKEAARTKGLEEPTWDQHNSIYLAAEAEEERTQTNLLRCVIGNPFRPVTADPAWLTSTVVGLAEGIYQERAFDRLPILADALQDAGCDNEDVLNHCRQPGEHCRGCWVIDLLTGRK